MVLSKDDILSFTKDYPHDMYIYFNGEKVLISKGWFKFQIGMDAFSDLNRRAIKNPNDLEYSIEHQLINQTTHFSAN